MLKPIMLLVICTNITPSEAEVRLPTWRGSLLENGRTRNPLNLRSVLVHVQVWCIYRVTLNVQLKNATTITNITFPY